MQQDGWAVNEESIGGVGNGGDSSCVKGNTSTTDGHTILVKALQEAVKEGRLRRRECNETGSMEGDTGVEAGAPQACK